MPSVRDAKRSREEMEQTEVPVTPEHSSRDVDIEPLPSDPTPLLVTAVASSPPPPADACPSLPPAPVDHTRPAISAYALRWQRFGSLLVLDGHSSATARIPGNSRIAAFDMDSTLIVPKSNARFPRHRGDWRWLHPEVPLKLRALYGAGYKLLVFTNQRGISLGQTTEAAITGKISDLLAQLDCPAQAFVATYDDAFRKPGTGMWQKFVHDHNGGVQVDLAASVFVGDAAGRASGWDGNAGTRKDHSMADRNFALNVGIPFATPEPYFLGHKEAAYKQSDIASFFSRQPVSQRRKMEDRKVEEAKDEGEDQIASEERKEDETNAAPASIATATVTVTSASTIVSSSGATISQSVTSSVTAISTTDTPPLASSTTPLHAKSHQELVLFSGPPASGKSTYARKHFLPHGYTHINQDTLRSKEKCLKQTALALAAGRSVVVDNTNPAADTRALYVALARQHGVPVRCFVFTTPLKLAQHLNLYRERASGGSYKRVPPIAYSTYAKKAVKPAQSEGFAEVVEVEFVPQFASDAERKLFEQRY